MNADQAERDAEAYKRRHPVNTGMTIAEMLAAGMFISDDAIEEME